MRFKNENAPAVSVIVPAYNAGEFLREAIDSVLAQTYRDFEVIVVDDGSTDHTRDVLRIYGSAVRSIRQKNGGAAAARNCGILNSSGRYIAFLDADDVWLPAKLERQVSCLERHPQLVAAYSDSRDLEDGILNPESRLARFGIRASGRIFEDLLRHNFLHTSSVVVRRTALAEAGLFDASLRGSEDIDLWMRLSRVGDFGCVDEVLAYYRRHSSNTYRTIDFSHAMVRARRIMSARWGDDPLVARQVRTCTGADYWSLAYKLWQRGDYRDARRAYLKSGLCGNRPLASLARATFCCLPSRMISVLSSLRSSDRRSWPATMSLSKEIKVS